MADASDSAPQEPGPQRTASQGRPEAEAGRDVRRAARRLFWPGGLSLRLLILTVLFVALAGLMILPSSLAQFEDSWLIDRVRAAELASLAVDAAPGQVVSDKQSQELLNGDRPLIAVDTRGETVHPRELPARAILAFGTERHGLSEALLTQAHASVSLPMRPGVSSLNLATSVAALLYAWRLAGGDGGR